MSHVPVRSTALSLSSAVEGSGIPDRVRAFVCEHVRSYEVLAVLVLFRRHGNVPATVPEAARELGLAEPVVACAASTLAALGVVAAAGEGAYAYAPRSDELDGIVACIARLHDEQLADVIQMMNERAIERVRESAVRHFGLTRRFRFSRGGSG